MYIRTNLILFGVLGLTLLAFWYTMGLKTTEERRRDAEFLLPSLNSLADPARPADFTRLELRRSVPLSETLVFVRSGPKNAWRLVSPINVRTDSEAVESLVRDVMGLKRLPISDSLRGSLADYGLTQPVVVVTLGRGEKGEDSPVQLRLGQVRTEADAPLYASSSETPDKPAEVDRRAIAAVFQPREHFRARDLVQDPGPALASVKIERYGQESLVLELAGENDWRIKQPPRGYAERQPILSLVQQLSQLRVELPNGYRDNLDDARLKELGLAPTPRLAITLRAKEADPKKPTAAEGKLLIGNREQKAEERLTARRVGLLAALGPSSQAALPAELAFAHLAAAGENSFADALEGVYYAKVDSDPYAVVIRTAGLTQLQKRPEDYRSRHLARFDMNKIDAIDVTLRTGEIKKLEFRRPSLNPGAVWDLYSDTRAKVKTDGRNMQLFLDLLQAVEVPNAAAFLDSAALEREWFGMDPVDLGLTPGFEQAEIRLWQEGLRRTAEGSLLGADKPELKEGRDKTPDLVLRIGRRDEKRKVTYVQRTVGDQPPAVLAVLDPFTGQPNASLSELATAGYYGYRDRALPGFRPDGAESFTLTRGRERFEFVRDAATPWGWKIAKPIDAPANNYRGVFEILAKFRADVILTDRPSERDLKEQFGLTEQPLFCFSFKQKSQTAGDKFDEYIYTVGKLIVADGPHKGKYYARVEHLPASGPPPESNQFVILLVRDTVRQLDIEPREPVVFPIVEKLPPQELALTWRKLSAEKKVEETKLVLENKPGEADGPLNWTVKSLTGPDPKPELSKLNLSIIQGIVRAFGFLSAKEQELKLPGLTLSTPRFLQHGGDPPADFHLNPADPQHPPSLVIELKYEDGKATRTLTIGSGWEPDSAAQPGLSGKFYRAAASTVPGVFVLEEEKWKQLLTGPQVFKTP